MRRLGSVLIAVTVSIVMCGCGGGGGGSDHADGLPGGSDDSQGNFHPTDFATDPQHGRDYSENPQYCRSCHGDDLRGGSSGISCVACHHSFVELYCEGCHEDADINSHGTHTQGTAKGPEAMGCADCHFGTDKALIPDACDDCHSPNGAFDGVQMGLDNWDNVYETDGETLIAGQDDWCLSCHDDDPSTVENESSFISGVYAPNIAGDENNGDTYGFNITGHKIGCLNCHVASKDHIDGEHRTYEVEKDGEADQFVPDGNTYVEGYRLQDGSLNVPAPPAVGIDTTDYELCFDCHNPDEVLGMDVDDSDVSHTNFWDAAPQVTSIGNAHTYHVGVQGLRGDTDWDGVVDGRETCVTCHNVHGSSTKMLRYGELISTPGTTDRVPALNFTYVVTSTDLATATWTSPPLDAGIYEVQVHVPTDVLDNHAGDASYTVSHDGGANVEVSVDQQIDGGVWVSLGANFSYNQGSTGTVLLDNDFTTGVWVLADAVRWVGGTTYLVDNPDVAFSPAEDWLTWSDDPGTWNFVGDDFRYTGRPIPNPDPAVTLAQSVGGWTRYGSGAIASNHICRACHSDGPALYQRTPNLWPKVLTTPGPVPDTVSNNGTGSSLITVTISDPDNNVDTVTIDLTPIGGGAAQSMTANGDGAYSYTLHIPAGTTDAGYDFEVTATDLDGNTGSGEVTLNVVDPNATYVDNADATVSPDCSPPCDASTEWAYFTTDQAFEENFRYKERDPAGTGTVVWTPTVPETANYEVYAWWDDGSTLANPLAIRSKNVSYTIEVSADDGGTWSELASFTVDQTIEGPGGGQWNQLGSESHTFSAGVSARVVLNDDATLAPVGGGTTYVIGDAVKFVQVP